jgi:hypothetical protein
MPYPDCNPSTGIDDPPKMPPGFRSCRMMKGLGIRRWVKLAASLGVDG